MVGLTPATSSAVTTTTQAPARDLGEPKPSGVEGLPVPNSAVKVEYEPLFPDTEITETWKVPGATVDALVVWYRQHVPVGQDWRGWSWCLFEERASAVQWYWMRGTEQDLTLVVVQDNPPGIVLATGEAYEPC